MIFIGVLKVKNIFNYYKYIYSNAKIFIMIGMNGKICEYMNHLSKGMKI